MREGSRLPRTYYSSTLMLDSSALVAIVDKQDTQHLAASRCLSGVKEKRTPILVTSLTIAETHRRLLHHDRIGREGARRFLCSMYDDSINIVRPQEADEQAALAYLDRYSDQDLTLADAVILAVCHRLGVLRVFTYDWHLTLTGLEQVQ